MAAKSRYNNIYVCVDFLFPQTGFTIIHIGCVRGYMDTKQQTQHGSHVEESIWTTMMDNLQ